MIRKQFIRSLGLLAVGLAASLGASAQAWPAKPVVVIVPFPAGGTSDMLGRLAAEALGKSLKQAFVVDNKGGAGGAIGTKAAAIAPADGYTLVLTGVGTNAVMHGINPNAGYDSMKDFVHVTQLMAGPNVLVVNPSLPFRTLKDIVDYDRANPGKLSYAQTPGASGHMAMELFKLTAGGCLGPQAKSKDCRRLTLVGIPYRGGGPALNDVLAGTVPMMFINQDTALGHVKAGKLRAIAVSSAQRNPLFPDVPTVAESGYPGFEATSWSGISAPKGTPPEVVRIVEAELVKAFNSPEIKGKLESQGFVVAAKGSQAYTAFVAGEIARWGEVIRVGGIKADQ